jgi:two-component system OmpR family sensor kinase
LESRSRNAPDLLEGGGAETSAGPSAIAAHATTPPPVSNLRASSEGGSEGAGAAAARERLAIIGEIAAEVAHELRNVLQVIAASAYLARQEAQRNDAPATAPHIAKIERNARLAHGIVDDLMALARGEAMHAEPILLAEVLVAARADLQPDAANWEDEVVPHDLRVRAHAGLLARMLHALYDNAIAASAPRTPAIATRARLEGDGDGGGRAIVEIADDGPGIAAEIAAHVFEPLVTGRPGGTGLGLALARRVAAAHGGSIELVSGEGGATFRVELPAGR